jgi:hypothetical protein
MGDQWFFNQVRDAVRKGGGYAELLLPTKDYVFRHDQGSFWMASYRIPQSVGTILGSLLDSSSMFKLATMLPFAFPKSQIVLQDFMLPQISVVPFFDGIQKLLDIYPVWLLPMSQKHKTKGNIFTGLPVKGASWNVGVYGIPKKAYDFIPANKDLEALLFRYHGRKVYYSHSFYSRAFFYDHLHDGKAYFSLRRKYCKNGAFPEIYDKIITKSLVI